MKRIPDSYSLRSALPAYAEVIARHRVMMFQEMKAVTTEESEMLFAASSRWLEDVLRAGEYAGWFLMFGGKIVAGAGVHLREAGPVPGCCRVGRGGHIMNVYTVEAHRGRGLARFLMEKLEWSVRNHVDPVTLTASDFGRPFMNRWALFLVRV